jgi:hypothetical protein
LRRNAPFGGASQAAAELEQQAGPNAQALTGRFVALVTLVDRARVGTEDQVFAFMVAYRLEIRQPGDLCNVLPVLYYKDDQGVPAGCV